LTIDISQKDVMNSITKWQIRGTSFLSNNAAGNPPSNSVFDKILTRQRDSQECQEATATLALTANINLRYRFYPSSLALPLTIHPRKERW